MAARFDLTRRHDNFVRAMINVTDNAVRQLRVLLEAQAPKTQKGLRVQIAKGGCSGLQYEMSLDSQKTGDSIVENPNAARTCGCGTSFEAARSA